MSINIRSTWHAFKYLPYFIWASIRFPAYKPQPITLGGFSHWISQFDHNSTKDLLKLLNHVIYITEAQTEDILVKLNTDLLRRLNAADINIHNIIYVQMHDPGSSSPLMLNILRDRGKLDNSGCHFIDWKDIREFSRATSELGQGAIIYVDDFAGSGHQFCQVRENIAEFIVGTFAEFFLLPVICEEALAELEERGVEPVTHLKHYKAERPLHPESTIFDNNMKDRLTDICRQVNKNGALGYRELATMVVFYRNSPTTIPVIFRGSAKQSPWVGIFPRTTDLPKS